LIVVACVVARSHPAPSQLEVDGASDMIAAPGDDFCDMATPPALSWPRLGASRRKPSRRKEKKKKHMDK